MRRRRLTLLATEVESPPIKIAPEGVLADGVEGEPNEEIEGHGDNQPLESEEEKKNRIFRQKYRIRRAKIDDLDEIAELSVLVFDRDMLDEAIAESNPIIRPVTRLFAELIFLMFLQDYSRNIKACLERKAKLAPIARNQARGMNSRYMRYALTNQNDGRMFNVLVCEDKDTNKIIGTVTVFKFAAESPLPTPIPSMHPKRLYASTLAVDPSYRRQGIARQLMGEAEKMGARWGQEYMYLHVLKPNIDAQLLYYALGYELVKEDPWWNPEQRYLLRKKISDGPRGVTNLPRINM